MILKAYWADGEEILLNLGFFLQGFYEEVSSPLLLDVELNYPDNNVESLTKNQYSQLFNGSEIVVAGLLSENDIDNFMVEVLAEGVRNGQQAIFLMHHVLVNKYQS